MAGGNTLEEDIIELCKVIRNFPDQFYIEIGINQNKHLVEMARKRGIPIPKNARINTIHGIQVKIGGYDHGYFLKTKTT